MSVYRALAIHFDSVGAGTDEERELTWPFPGKWKVEKVFAAPSTATAANATNYTTVSLSANDGGGGSYRSLGSLDTSTVALAVGTSRELTMNAAVSAEVDQGDILRVGKADAGSGAVFDGGVTILASRVD